jgi:hypothetical protein
MVVAILLGSGGLSLAQKEDGGKPLVTVAFSGYQALMKDLAWIDGLAGKPGLPKMLQAQIAMVTGGKGLAGLDQKRPWGLIVKAGSGDFPLLAFVPVTNLKQLLGALQGVLGEPSESEGIYEFAAGAQTVYVKEAKGWAFISRSKDGLDALPADPIKELAGLPEKYTIAVQAAIKNIPEELKQMFLPLLQMGMQAGLEPMPGESDEQFALRKKMSERVMEQFTTMVNELDTLTFGLGVDAQAGNVHFEYTITAKPGTATAKQLADVGQTKTNFGGFLMKDAAAAMNFVSKLQEADIAQVESLVAASRANAEREIDRQELSSDDKKKAKQLLGDLIEVLQATLKAGTIDGGFVVKLDASTAAAAAGMALADGQKLNATVKKLVEQIAKDEPQVAKVIKLDAQQRDGVHFHTLSLPVDALGGEGKAELTKMVGQTLEVIVAIGDKAAYVAAGRDAATLLKTVMDQSKQSAGAAVPPAQMFVAGAPIARFVQAVADEGDKDEAAKAVKILEGASGKDRVTMTMTAIPNGANVRLEVQAGVISLLQLAPIPKAGDE